MDGVSRMWRSCSVYAYGLGRTERDNKVVVDAGFGGVKSGGECLECV